VQLTATPRDANDNPLSGRTITWASDNTTVARVSTSGLVTGVVAGLATITATSEGRSGTAAITVANLPVASVTVSPASASVQVGATLQLTATARDASGNLLSGRAVTWASSNTAAATVSASGRVTGVATGAATITATSEGQNGTSAITVIPVPPPPTAGGIWGIYPNCIAPATPIEMHSWWDEDSLGERVPFVVRVMSYNNPSTISITRWAWESSVEQVVPMNVRCTSAVPTYKLVGGRPECTWYVNMTVDPATALAGIDEIRLTSNIPSHDGLSTRQYTSLNFQLPIEGKTGSYRSTTDPIGRGWYTGLEYANILVGYGDLLRSAGLDRTVPVVSGIVPIRVRSQNLAGDVKVAIYENMNHHADPTFWKTASVGDVSGPGGGKLLFASNSSYSGTFNWDTRNLPDGRHKLYFQVQETDSRGLNAAALLLLFDVCNSGNC
jgi:Bacterial Ig-like domain (group 2)